MGLGTAKFVGLGGQVDRDRLPYGGEGSGVRRMGVDYTVDIRAVAVNVKMALSVVRGAATQAAPA